MQAVRRSAVAWYVAALVPLSLLAIFYFAMLLDQTWRQTEEVAVDRAREVLEEVDAKLERDLAALALAARLKPWIADREGWFEKLLPDFPQWREIALTESGAGATIRLAAVAQAASRTPEEDARSFAAGDMDFRITGIDKARYGCLCIEIQQKRGDLVLTLLRDVSDFYSAVSAQVGPGEVAALIDRDGRFVARTLDNAGRIGQPASAYARGASARGGGGVYNGVTLEGLNNRSAYATSALTGWSAHIAVPARSYRLLSTGYLVFALAAVAVALAFAGGVSWFGLRDLQLARQHERARLQSYKLEAIGGLASAIVHDFNNLLAIMNASFAVLTRSDNAEKREFAAREGLLASDRGAKLVGQLLAFAREKPPEIVCVDLSAAVEDIRDLIARSLTPAVRFACEIAPDACFALTNRAQLELVLLNFATNARDAMPEGGEFSISTRRSSSPGRVDLVIRDTGPGMTKEVAARAFEPFFTTKPEGKGTGLGLAQAQLLATDSDATLSLDTAPGRGCVFVYSFRACAPQA